MKCLYSPEFLVAICNMTKPTYVNSCLRKFDELETKINETLSLTEERFIVSLEKDDQEIFRQQKLEARIVEIEWAIVELEKRIKSFNWDSTLMTILDLEENVTNLQRQMQNITVNEETLAEDPLDYDSMRFV